MSDDEDADRLDIDDATEVEPFMAMSDAHPPTVAAEDASPPSRTTSPATVMFGVAAVVVVAVVVVDEEADEASLKLSVALADVVTN